MADQNEAFIIKLFNTGAVKFGEFLLKSGITSPIYFDFRGMISYPSLLAEASEEVWSLLQQLEYVSICGVPYTALPIASCVATTHNVPMLLKRKEMKNYGTKKILEGHFKRGDKCVIIEDVVTSGGSVLETVSALLSEGLKVTDVITLLDRNQGGKQNLENHGITLHSVMSIRSIMSALESKNFITSVMVEKVNQFISSNQLSNQSIIDPIEDIVLRLHEIGSFRFGSFKLSNGQITPIYVDLRLVISHPLLMSDICSQLYQLVDGEVEFDILCGVPYAALHLATCMSKDQNLNNVLLRKTIKAYGTGKLIEGVYQKEQKCLVVEDVMVSGQGIYEACESLKSQGLVANQALLVLDRQQKGETNLQQLGIQLHCLIRVYDALDILVKHKRINAEIASEVKQFLEENPAAIPLEKSIDDQRTSKLNELLPFDERANLCSNPVAKKIFTIMAEKSTNLCLSADVSSTAQLLELAENTGPYICILKTHVDILDNFTMDAMRQLQKIADKHQFVIFEDRKFADIGSTVQKQYSGGVFQIADWAELVNAHSIPGPGIVQALKQVGLEKQRACLLVAEMSSKGNLANASYAVATVKMAQENSDFVIGFISQSKLTSEPTLLQMTPGVKIETGGDSMGQNYTTPEHAVTLRGADVIIVGRGITQADDVVSTCKLYQEAGFQAYECVRASQRSDR